MTLNVLVVDDSLMYRGLLSDIIKDIPHALLAGTAANGCLAIEQIKMTPPDIVLLDITMPEMDGFETLKAIKRDYPEITVVMISSANRTQADITIRALSSGAYDFISKPESEDIQATISTLKGFLVPIFDSVLAKQKQISPKFPAVSLPASPKKFCSKSFHAVCIAVSTGGPDALQQLIPKLNGNLGCPVFVVQHMPPVFTASLAAHLDKNSALTVKEAEQGENIKNNTVYIAPGGRHMTATKGLNGPIIRLNDDPPENSCRPAADVLFRSLPNLYQGHLLSVVLTGIGSDGTKGVKAIKDAGGYCLAQNESSCVVYGMPRSVFEAGLTDEVLDLHEVPSRIHELLQVKSVASS